MSQVIKREPFALDDLFDDLLRGYWVRPMRYPGGMPAEAETQSVRMDVKEDDKAFTVHADMPGVNKEDIHVSIDGHTVSIVAEVKKTGEQKEGERVIKRERYYGKVSRSFSLGQELDENAASARFENGVLELVLPKKTAVAARRLNIA